MSCGSRMTMRKYEELVSHSSYEGYLLCIEHLSLHLSLDTMQRLNCATNLATGIANTISNIDRDKITKLFKTTMVTELPILQIYTDAFRILISI